jgi:hypothetical protein
VPHKKEYHQRQGTLPETMHLLLLDHRPSPSGK